MANQFQAQNPQVSRQRRLADMLRQQSAQPMQGQMVSGQYVSPSWSQGLNKLFQGYASGRLENIADETEQTQRSELSQALRTPQAPPVGIRHPNYQPEPLTERLSALTDNPQAQNMAMALRLSQAEQAMQPPDLMNVGGRLIDPRNPSQPVADYSEPESPNLMNVGGRLIDPNRPTQPVADYSEPEEPGALIQNEQGEWVPNPAYISARSQIAEAGKSDVNVNVGAEDMQTEQGKVLGRYLGEEFTTLQTQASEAAQQNAQLDRMEDLLEGVNTGVGVPTLTQIQGLANTFGMEVGENLEEKEAAESLANQIALRFRNPESGMGLPGATSDRDIAFLKSLPPGLSQSEEGRSLITESFRKINKRKIDVAKKAREMILQNQRQNITGLTFSDLDTLQNMWSDPIFDEDFIESSQKAALGMPKSAMDAGVTSDEWNAMTEEERATYQ